MEFYLYQRKTVDYNYIQIINHSMQLQLRIDIYYHKSIKYKIKSEEQNGLQSLILQIYIIDYKSIKAKNGKQPFK